MLKHPPARWYDVESAPGSHWSWSQAREEVELYQMKVNQEWLS